jgi:CheY-like chemotaxis protein
VGRLEIRVRADGDVLHLEVADDGRGIDPERVKAAAIARRLVTAERAALLSPREALDLVFTSGLSTRDQVTELSGRGVGMDVVKRKGAPAVQHRGRPVALVTLGALLGLETGPTQDKPAAVIVRHGTDCAALVVDGFVDEREVAVKPCGGELLSGAPFIAGTAALEDGGVAVLLHVPDVMAEVRRATRPGGPSRETRRLRVLLVDDSPIARATEAALVKALGHTVDEAQDGEEGLARVRAGAYDLVLTDVQMPKMDGFTLTRRIKLAPELRRMPVIILSSLASPEDKRRGAEAGADAYLVKAELAVETLAQAIERLT